MADSFQPLIVPEMSLWRGMTNVDFPKIDTDGSDFAILDSFDGCLDRSGILSLERTVLPN